MSASDRRPIFVILCWGVCACGGEVSLAPQDPLSDATARDGAATDAASLDADAAAPPNDGNAMDGPAVTDARSDASLLADGGADASLLTTNGFLMSYVVTGNSAELSFENAITGPGGRCALQHTGACYVTDCRSKAGGDAGALTGVPAGEIRIVLDNATEVVVANPDPLTGLYATQPGGGLPYPPTVSSASFLANGLVVPAFAVPLVFIGGVPGGPIFPADGGAAVYNRASDFIVRWVHHPGRVGVELVEPGPKNADLRALCEFDGSQDGGVIPAAILSAFDVGMPLSLFTGGLATSDITPGGYAIHVALIEADEGSDSSTIVLE